jgi:three-Cys-motif partner protein
MMSDSLPTVWSAEPHTLAKHAILREYLKAWMPILARQSNLVRAPAREILFVDGFAGPGRYSGGEPGSPIIALDAALSHTASFPVPVRFVFIEKDPARHESLSRILTPYFAHAASSKQIRIDPPVLGDCQHELGGLLTAHEQRGTRFGPALVFLDQFGYSEVPMTLVKRILQFPECEVFSYLDWAWMNRFMSDQTKWAGISDAFGGDDWKAALNEPPNRRERLLKDAYVHALRKRGGSKYVCYFSMFDSSDRLLYWLFFCTNNLRGLEEMKDAMWRVDATGAFKFSDRDDPNQLTLLSQSFDQKWLANHLINHFQNQALAVGAIREYVLTETPCRLYTEALRMLEKVDALSVPNPPSGRQRGSFSDKDMTVFFGFPPMFPIT